MVKIYSSIVLSLAVLFATPAFAITYTIRPHSDIVGELQTVTTKKGDTLYSIAREYDTGYLALKEVNPNVNPEKLKPGTKLVIPTEFILPPGDRSGIVINLAELKVYYFPPNSDTVIIHPLGIGQQGWRTPIGETTIAHKREHPTWTPPAAIRAEDEAKGIELPDVVPAGPHNPLGEYAMNLGWNGYLMHGTNAPNSIGQRSSHGCMRMYPEDIKELFQNVAVGTKVRVIYEPYKVGVKNGQMYLEAHEFFPDNYYQIRHADKYGLLQEVVGEMNYPRASNINWDEAKQLIQQHQGVPVNITDGQNTI